MESFKEKKKAPEKETERRERWKTRFAVSILGLYVEFARLKSFDLLKKKGL
jgi:hypothetical protein